MTYSTILTDTSEQIFTVTLNRPDKLNALSPTLMDEMKTALDAIKDDDTVSVVIIKSTGPVFSAGYDLTPENWVTTQYPADYPNGVEIEQDRQDIAKLLNYWMDLREFPKPIIAQIQGPCLSGAGELLAVADLAVASNTASFGHPAARDLGIPPTVFFWPLLIGMRKTKELLYTAKSLSADEALGLGLINRVVSPDDLDVVTRALAADIARTPINHLSILKQATDNWYDNMGLARSTQQASNLDADFHQSPTFLAFFKLVRDKGMKAALTERKKRFG